MRRIVLFVAVFALLFGATTATARHAKAAVATPTSLTATAKSDTEIDLSWTDNATNETGYRVERSPTGTGSWSPIAATLPANTASYQDKSGLKASTKYYYRVRAYNSANGKTNYSNPSNVANATTLAAGSGLIFSDTFDRDADTFVPPWDQVSQWTTGRVTTDPTHPRKGSNALKFYVENQDQLWGFSPRANVENWNPHECEGDDNYIGFSLYFPNDFPQTIPQWVNVSEFGYNNTDPTGYPATHFEIASGRKLDIIFYDSGAWNVPWTSAPITFGAWHDIVAHYHWSDDPNKGFVELWLDGQPQTFDNGSTKRYGQTLHVANNPQPCGWISPDLYFQKDQFPSLTMYMDEFKVGNSYADVAP